MMKVREVCMCAWKGFGKGEKKCPAWFCLLVLNPPTDTQLSSIDEEHKGVNEQGRTIDIIYAQ